MLRNLTPRIGYAVPAQVKSIRKKIQYLLDCVVDRCPTDLKLRTVWRDSFVLDPTDPVLLLQGWPP